MEPWDFSCRRSPELPRRPRTRGATLRWVKSWPPKWICCLRSWRRASSSRWWWSSSKSSLMSCTLSPTLASWRNRPWRWPVTCPSFQFRPTPSAPKAPNWMIRSTDGRNAQLPPHRLLLRPLISTPWSHNWTTSSPFSTESESSIYSAVVCLNYFSRLSPINSLLNLKTGR